MVRNYLSNVGKGKETRSKIFFQGGVAANIGIKVAFEKALGTEIHVPEYYDVMGSIGAAILAKEELMKSGKTNFKGFEVAFNNFIPRNIECNGCGNNCEVIEIKDGEKTVGCFGDRCGKWSSKMVI
ncbi:MAG: putative NodU family carbamoyl transferase [Clostridium sp.]|jgi:predicted NodU family carbamoyl transferase